MLKKIVQQRSLQTCLQTLTAGSNNSLFHAPSMQLTSLRNFSSPTDDTTAPESTPPPSEPQVNATEAATTTTPITPPQHPQKGRGPQHPTSAAMLQNAKLWRQWVDGRIDDRNRGIPNTTVTFPPPPGTTDQQQQQRQRQQQKFRPKEPSKDWRNASRSMRSSQDRIASILAPEGGGGDAQSYPHQHQSGKYGILGTAADAPRHIPGAAAKAEETSPTRLLPHRLFYPGATYSPEDLDPYKAKPVTIRSDLAVWRGSVSKANVAMHADFRNPLFLNNFISDAGKLQPRRRTRLPAKMHRDLARQVKLSRALALMCPTEKIKPARPPFRTPFRKPQYTPVSVGSAAQTSGGDVTIAAEN